jgi:multimeric flavodoxin WrbA
MSLFISCSNRKGNSYQIAQDLAMESDKFESLAAKNIKFCLGCDRCKDNLEQKCVQLDDMQDLYASLEYATKIILVIPIYFDNVNGLFKNFVDRLNPLYHQQILKDKEIFFITVGEQSEKENLHTSKNLEYFFSKLAEVFEFKYEYLKNLSSGESNDVKKNNDNYEKTLKELREKISEGIL